jgi:hypothetical protein
VGTLAVPWLRMLPRRSLSAAWIAGAFQNRSKPTHYRLGCGWLF